MEEVLGYTLTGIARIGGVVIECLGTAAEVWVAVRAGRTCDQEKQGS
ncbi:hypothetical protein [Kitasatospora sp. NPDC001175]